jgi:hypothetical protein
MSRRPETIIKQARERIARIRETLGTIDYMCSGHAATTHDGLRQAGLPLRPGCERSPWAVL